MPDIRIGTSGRHYKHWIGRYYPRRNEARGNAAVVSARLPPLEITASWTYIRLHGPTSSKYQGSYSDRQLEQWARRIDDLKRKLRAVYLYFDNDDSAYAVNNALTLKELVGTTNRRLKRTA